MALKNCIEILQFQFLTVVREYESNYYTTDIVTNRVAETLGNRKLNKQE